MALTLEEVHSDDDKRIRKPILVKKKELQPWESFDESHSINSLPQKEKLLSNTNDNSVTKNKGKDTKLRNNSVTSKQAATSSNRNNSVTSEKNTNIELRNSSVTNNKKSSIKGKNNFNTPSSKSKNFKNDKSESKIDFVTNDNSNGLTIKGQTPSEKEVDLEFRNNTVTDSITNSVTIAEQLRNNKETPQKFRNNSVTNSVTVTEQLRNSDNYNSVTNSVTINKDLYSLTGVPKLILYFLAKLCLEGGSRVTPPINFSFLKESLNISSNEVVRVNIYRLIKKGLIRKIDHKTGKGGFQILAIEDHIYKDLIQHMSSISSVTDSVTPYNSNSVTNHKSSHAQHSVTNSVTSSLSSSSSSINTNKETNTNNDDRLNDPNQQNIFGLPEDWMSIDYERVKQFGFGTTQLKQLYKLEFYSAEDIQEYIDRLDYDTVHNDKTFRSGMLNGFMGILRKGDGYSPPKGYESPMEQALREELEQKKRHLDKIKNMENELFETSYETWVIESSEDDFEKIEGYSSDMRQAFKDGLLKTHFKNNIFKRNKDA
jgi:hypothetical protein